MQLLVFVQVVLLVRAVFVSAPHWLDEAFRRVLIPIHFFLCGYVVVAFLSRQFFCLDPSIVNLLSGAGPGNSQYFGFRPSGFGREPQWTAMSLAASYSGVHYLVPNQRLPAFLVLLAATIALGSATGILFLGWATIAVGLSAGAALRESWKTGDSA